MKLRMKTIVAAAGLAGVMMLAALIHERSDFGSGLVAA
jgi:hypothetical protein